MIFTTLIDFYNVEPHFPPSLVVHHLLIISLTHATQSLAVPDNYKGRKVETGRDRGRGDAKVLESKAEYPRRHGISL
jgi:hypothetical protein